MRTASAYPPQGHTHIAPATNDWDFICEMRSRLNVISTSIYLLETSQVDPDSAGKKYVDTIKRELESIRQLING